MRKIKFRGKTHGNGKWYYGSLVYSDEINAAIYFQIGRGLVKRMEWVYVIPETVGQFTGLTDKKGKRIFEGDILDCGDRVVFVKWHSYCGTWDSMFIKYSGERCSNGITPSEWKHRAVIIGNIHDNPELLKGE